MESLRQSIQQMTGLDPIPSLEKKPVMTAVKHQPAAVQLPPSHRAAKFYVGTASDLEGQAQSTTLPMKQAVNYQPAKQPLSSSEAAQMKDNKTGSLQKTVMSITSDVKVVPAAASSFKSWEKFN